MESQRYIFLDHAKAIAILLMVLLHTTSRYPLMSNIVDSFHMGVFFIISGVFFKESRNFKIVLSKSLNSLIVPYICFSILALTICWISPHLHPELYPGLNSWGSMLKAAVIGILIAPDAYTGYAFMPLGPLWFLLALFWCRLLGFYWIQSALRHRYGRVIQRVVIIFLLVAILFLKPRLLALNATVVSFPFFLMGYYGKQFVLGLPNKSEKFKILSLILSGLILFSSKDYIAYAAGLIYGNILVAYARGLAGAVLLLILCSYSIKFNYLYSFISLIGASIISILCLHFHLLYPTKVLYKLLGGDPGSIHIAFALIASFMIVITLTYLHGYLTRKASFLVGKGSLFKPISEKAL